MENPSGPEALLGFMEKIAVLISSSKKGTTREKIF
jgi:hypothetical protein